MTHHYPLICGQTPRIAAFAIGWILFSPSTSDTFRSSLHGQETEVIATPATAVTKSGPINPRRVAGEDKCVDCHKSEYQTWLTTYHANETFNKLRTNEKSRQFANKLGVPISSIAKNSLCVQCHATQQVDRGRHRAIAGVSCEACHGASGGDDGWLNLHAVYGPPGTQRDGEQPRHYEARVARCAQGGQNRVADPFRLARACYQCHMVWDEKLVNVAEHPAGNSQGFEFLAWSMGEARHNFHLDQTQNALVSTLWSNPSRGNGRQGADQEHLRMMYVAGQLAQLHVGLVNRAHAQDTEEREFVDQMNARIEDAQALLDEISEVFEEQSDKKLTPVRRAIAAAEEINDILEEVDPTAAPRFLSAAAEVEAAAAQFIKEYTGSELGFLEKEGFLPVVKLDPDAEGNQARYTREFRERTGRSP